MDISNLRNITETHPQLTYLFRTNIIPTKVETIQLKNMILDAEFNLTRLEVEIERTRAILERLQQEHLALLSQRDAYQSVISPIRRLPSEILGDIFLRVKSKYSNPNPRFAPLVLCQICSVWRNVAIGYPALWSAIEINITRTNYGSQINSTALWLDRAKPLPLRMILQTHVHEFFIMGPISDIIGRFFSACQEIDLRVPYTVWKDISRYPSGHVDLLEDLRLSIIRGSSGNSGNSHNLFMTTDSLFLHALRLRSACISFDEYMDPLSIQNLKIPLHQLTDLQLYNIDLPLDAGREIFMRCINLELLTLVIRTWDAGPIHTDSRVTLSKLHTFVASADEEEAISQIFEMLTLPMLSTLSLSVTEGYSLWPHQSYLDLRARSSFNITSFSNDSFDMLVEELEEVLATMPSLLHLDLQHFWDSTFLELLTFNPAHSLVPKLERIRVCRPKVEIDMKKLTLLIESRWWSDAGAILAPAGVSRLKSVHVDTYPWNPDDALTTRFQLDGMHFVGRG